jgi:phosphoribosylaminoimidazolecarboxamide formyltransferase/IMP cyclohydrolase
MGQVNRVDAARLAVTRAGHRARGSAAASDAYFPFPDGLLVLAEAGVGAVAEPGGSVRDGEVIEAASAAGISLYFPGVRPFWHCPSGRSGTMDRDERTHPGRQGGRRRDSR